VLHHIIFITACAQDVFPSARTKSWTLTPLANSTFNNHVTQSSLFAVDALFQFVELT